MTEHDARIMRPKNRPVDDTDALGEYARAHDWCAACGADYRVRHVHHILGGRCGRSDEDANLLMLCASPCHDLAEGLDVVDEADDGLIRTTSGHVVGMSMFQRHLPKLRALGIQLSLKLRLGELSAQDLERLAALHGRTLPDPEPIPAFFVEQWKRNRPELCR